MEPIKVIVRYVNGKVIKGFTQNFSPNKNRFHLHPAGKTSGEVVEVQMKDLKAMFYVRDFVGNAQYQEQKHSVETKTPGQKVEVTFMDGEVLIGSTLSIDPERLGFFLFPADPKGNNVKVFVVTSAVEEARFL